MTSVKGELAASTVATRTVAFGRAAAQDLRRVDLPANRTQSFMNYVGNDRIMNPDQAIRLFANDSAAKDLVAGGAFPYGSVLVAEIRKAKPDKDGKTVVSRLGRRIRGDLVAIGVMEKRRG